MNEGEIAGPTARPVGAGEIASASGPGGQAATVSPSQTPSAAVWRDSSAVSSIRATASQVRFSTRWQAATGSIPASVAYAQGEESDEELKVANLWVETLQNESLSIFMLSNQLPLLQLGRPAPTVVGQFPDYCTLEGDKREGRVIAESKLVAFSDPNDILSWSVPPGYEDQYMDSRMCPILTNVIINIAQVKKVLGIELAPPGDAHRNYDNDERVIKMIAHGVNENADPMIKERCEWLEVR